VLELDDGQPVNAGLCLQYTLVYTTIKLLMMSLRGAGRQTVISPVPFVSTADRCVMGPSEVTSPSRAGALAQQPPPGHW